MQKNRKRDQKAFDKVNLGQVWTSKIDGVSIGPKNLASDANKERDRYEDNER